MSSRATQSQLLEQRIAENSAGQQVDLSTWIFDRVQVRRGEKILELCCGTGAQTLPMLELTSESGHVVALDISQAALRTLVSRAGPEMAKRLTMVEGALDDISFVLSRYGLQSRSFDLIFCAYGLYYSVDPQRTLSELLSWLRPVGRLVIVGPFGPNNGPLFALLRDAGVSIPHAVTASSESFMTNTVLPWGVRHFESLVVHTMVNRVEWASPERVLNYWQNTTFYAEERRPEVAGLVDQHFQRHPRFVNEKWVMLVEMTHARP